MERARILAALAAGGLLGAAAGAQGGVAPRAYAEHWGNTAANGYPISKSKLRWQLLIEPAVLPATLTPGRTMSALGWRPGFGELTQQAPRLGMEIRVYDTALTRAAMSATFAQNVAASSGGVVLARRTVDLPPVTRYANPADAFFHFPFDAARPFAGPGLLVEVENTDSAPSTRSYLRDTDGCQEGNVRLLARMGAGCGGTGHFLQPAMSGSRYYVSLLGGRPFAPATGFFGLACVAQGPFRLPWALDFAGMTGCELLIRADASVATTLDANGSIRMEVPQIPRLYTQWAFLDPAANAAGIALTNAVYYQFVPPPCGMSEVSVEGDVTKPVGFGPRPTGKVTRIDYR